MSDDVGAELGGLARSTTRFIGTSRSFDADDIFGYASRIEEKKEPKTFTKTKEIESTKDASDS